MEGYAGHDSGAPYLVHVVDPSLYPQAGPDGQSFVIDQGFTIDHEGPQKRECTDVPCLILLLAFIYGLGAIYTGARTEGNLDKLTHGFDWMGNICGVDKEVADRPFLFWCAPGSGDELTLLNGICVSECPSSSDTQHWCPGQATPFERTGSRVNGTQEVAIGVSRTLALQSDYASIAAWQYCFPTQNLNLLNHIMDNTHMATLTKQIYLACHGALESWQFLVGVAGVCIVIGYVFLFVLWFCFPTLVYGLVIAAHVALLLASYAFVYAGFHDDHNVLISYFEPHTASVAAWTCGAVTLVLWVLFSLFCCYSRNAVSVTIDSVRASCEVITHLPTILLQPLAHSLLVLSILLALLYGFAWLLSTGKVVTADTPLKQSGIEIEGLHRHIEFSGWQWGCIVYWLFGLVWIFETVNALGQFAISHAVTVFACFQQVEWFPMLHGYFAGLVFHLGTLAFGAFIISCLRFLAAVMAYLAKQAEGETGLHGVAARVCCCCCAQCVVLIERLMTMINDLVYTDVALRGVGYVAAAENVVRIAASNPVAYISIKGSATAIRVLGVTVIGGLGTFLSYQVLSSSDLHHQMDSLFEDSSSMLVTSNILGTTIAAGLICFYIAMAFMMVFSQTTCTLMYCTLIGVLTIGDDGPDGVITLQRRDMHPGRLMVDKM